MTKSGLADSPFFKPPSFAVEPGSEVRPTSATVDEQANARTQEHPNARTDERVNSRSSARTNTRTHEREICRQSYNVYRDQHELLKRLEAKGALSGKSVPISVMVREALDEYLLKHS